MVKLFVRFSLPLNKIFSPSFSLGELEKLREASKNFASYLEKNKDRVIEFIPKFTGFEWKRHVINIYICKNFPLEGISDPLILKFNQDADMMFYYLLHELVHVNLMNDEILSLRKKSNLLKPGHDGLEVVVSIAVKHLLSTLWSERRIKKVIENDIRLHKEHEKMWEKAEKLGWNLFKKPLKTYLEKI